jgi:drug/metabolite transporter (DMT)-like permease
VKLLGQFAIIALIALAIVALPGGGSALEVVLTLLTVAFFAAIALLAARLYREHRFELDSLEPRTRFVLYASIGAALLTFTATNRLFDSGGLGVLAWLALLGICSYGIFWVWTQYRAYD